MKIPELVEVRLKPLGLGNADIFYVVGVNDRATALSQLLVRWKHLKYGGSMGSRIIPSGLLSRGRIPAMRNLSIDYSLFIKNTRSIYSDQGPGLARGNFCSTRPWFQATGEWRAEGSSLDCASCVTILRFRMT